MTSPYLDRIRSTRETIEDLIAAREVEQANASAAAQRQRIERDLALLHDELGGIDSRNVDKRSATDSGLLRDECPRHRTRPLADLLGAGTDGDVASSLAA